MKSKFYFIYNILFSLWILPNSSKPSSTSKFLIDPENKTTRSHPKSCPKGYKLANLDSYADWNEACQLALKILGYDESAWIQSGLSWRGIGNEYWSLITPKPPGSCKFPPDDFKSFCIPISHFRLSPSQDFNLKLASICAKNKN